MLLESLKSQGSDFLHVFISICNAMIFQTTYDGESKCNVVINCHHAINSMIHINIGFYDFELYILLS